MLKFIILFINYVSATCVGGAGVTEPQCTFDQPTVTSFSYVHDRSTIPATQTFDFAANSIDTVYFPHRKGWVWIGDQSPSPGDVVSCFGQLMYGCRMMGTFSSFVRGDASTVNCFQGSFGIPDPNSCCINECYCRLDTTVCSFISYFLNGADANI